MSDQPTASDVRPAGAASAGGAPGPRGGEGGNERYERGGGRGERGGDRGHGDGREGRPKRRFRGRGRRKVCRFCADKTLNIDYKWAEVLEDFISERGRIVPSRTSGTCAKHQRRLKLAIKQARNVALLPYARA